MDEILTYCFVAELYIRFPGVIIGEPDFVYLIF